MRPHAHFFEYKKQLEQAVYDLDSGPIMAAADILFEAWQNQKSVYIFGNGGSWSTAEHFACDLRKWSRTPGSGGVRAQALTLTPLATAYANDHSYDEIFTRQLNDLMQEGDVAVGITCGMSDNVLNALYFGPMLFEDSVAIIIIFYLPFAFHSCSFKTKIYAADACK